MADWSGRIGKLRISMVCSSLHWREGRSQQSSLGFKKHGLDQRAEDRADFARLKVFFYPNIEKF